MSRYLYLLDEIIEPLKKVLTTLKNNRDLFSAGDWEDKKRMTVENLENHIANHLTSVDYELFGITELEGWRIRAYFQMSCLNDGSFHVLTLHKEFPDLLEPESKEYLDDINERRKRAGFEPINFD